MRRSDIISYLWSESSDDAAKYNLRFNLWQIKKALVQADGGARFCWCPRMISKSIPTLASCAIYLRSSRPAIEDTTPSQS